MFLQSEKAASPITLVLFGIDTPSRLTQPAKAQSSMWSSSLGKDMVYKTVTAAKGRHSDVCNIVGNCYVFETAAEMEGFVGDFVEIV